MDKVYYNGKIITMSGTEDSEYVPEAVLVRDGKIKSVGTLRSMENLFSQNVERINLQGRCLMPAFIDAHSHIVMNGQMALFADLSDCGSFDDIVAVLDGYRKEHHISETGVIIGQGYDHNFLKEGSHPGRQVLDRVSREIPVMILHVSGHLACVNTSVLELAGIGKDTQEPEGGMIGRRAEDGEPDGYLEEAALGLAQAVVWGRVRMDMGAVMDGMQRIYLENGITTVQDGASSAENIELLKKMGEMDLLKLDVVAYPMVTADGTEIAQKYKELCGNYENHLKIGGYKMILDGSPQGRSAWLSEPYMGGEKDYCGYPTLDDGTVERCVRQAVDEGRQILVHCNGDAASEQFLRAYEKCAKDMEVQQDIRPVMIHCQTVRNDQLDRMAKLKMIASIFIGHVWYWGDIHMKNLGETRGRHISPVRDALDRGVTVTFHQDTPVTKPDMLHSIWCAVNRVSRRGNKIGEEQKVTVYEALKTVTINGAYQYFEEDKKGSIEEGKNADFVILSQSPLELKPEDIKNICVMETIKDGVTVYKK